MDVYENLVMMGAYLRSDKKEIMDSLESVYVLFPKLKERRHQKGGTLSGGEQQMLAIGRALMSKPKLLLLDEPSLGLAPSAVQDLARRIREIHASGVTVLLVEQNARMALGISDRAYVLEVGKIALSGKAKDLIQIDQVRKAYLGM
jgi:branched-chain amino acid transport system ATP-binding protein